MKYINVYYCDTDSCMAGAEKEDVYNINTFYYLYIEFTVVLRLVVL